MAEAGLLELARDLAASPPGAPECATLARALVLLEAAFRPGAPLPRQLAQAWLRARGNKTAALALGWAREQVRRALADIVRDARGAETPGEDAAAESAAWLLLAAAEGESREVGGSVGDRLSAVYSLLFPR